MGSWLAIYNRNNNNTTNGIDLFNEYHELQVYDILNQILDPCQLFQELEITKDVRLGIESVISGVTVLYNSFVFLLYMFANMLYFLP